MGFNIGLIISILLIYIGVNSMKNLKREKRESVFLFLSFLLFFILTGWREMTVGNDTQSYINLFKICSTIKWEVINIYTYFETGYLILNILISYISSSSRMFMMIVSLIFNMITYKFIKENSYNYLLSVIMYVCLLFFYSSMTMLRQFFSILIILSGFKYVKKKKIIHFIFTVILASFFHSTAWLALLIYPIYHIKYKKKYVIIIFVASFITILNLGSIFTTISNLIEKNSTYMDNLGDKNMANTLYAITYFLMYLFAIYEIYKNEKDGKINDENNNFYLYSLLMAAVVNMIAINMNVLSRAALYFNIFSIISLPNIIHNNVKNIYNKKILNVAILLIFVIYSNTIIYFRPEWNSAFNYKSCIIKKNGYICED